MGSEVYSDFTIIEKLFISTNATLFVMFWGEHLKDWEHDIDAVQRLGDPRREKYGTRASAATATILYGIPGSVAGCMLGVLFFRPTIVGLFIGVPVLMGVYVWTHMGFTISDEFKSEHSVGMDGDGI